MPPNHPSFVKFCCYPFLLLLSLTLPAGAALGQITVEARPYKGASTADTAKANENARLLTVYFGFMSACDSLRLPPAWLRKDASIDFDVLPATAALLRQPTYAVVQPDPQDRGEFYVARVFAKDDRRKKKPLYLYLLAARGNRTEIVRGFQFQDGKPQKIAG